MDVDGILTGLAHPAGQHGIKVRAASGQDQPVGVVALLTDQ